MGLIMTVVLGMAFRIFQSLERGRAGVAHDAAAQAGFTSLCEHLQRDLAGPLAGEPEMGDNILDLTPSGTPGVVAYRLDATGRAITRTDQTGKTHAFPFASGPRGQGSFQVMLRRGAEPDVHLLTFQLRPRTEAPDNVLERVFPIRWQDLSRGFFQDTEPGPP